MRIYNSLENLILLYIANKLPEDELAFPYYSSEENRKNKKYMWIHKDLLKNHALLYQNKFGNTKRL